jgi:hypothetical protein
VDEKVVKLAHKLKLKIIFTGTDPAIRRTWDWWKWVVCPADYGFIVHTMMA